MLDERIMLLGQSADDFPAISALLQDATLRAEDVAWDRRRRRLVLLVNRYRWEASISSRVRSALRLETVKAVQRQNWPIEPDVVLDLLSVTLEGEWLLLTFAAGVGLRAQVEVAEVVVEDLDAPWLTGRVPSHPT